MFGSGSFDPPRLDRKDPLDPNAPDIALVTLDKAEAGPDVIALTTPLTAVVAEVTESRIPIL
jgi:hypothetical protein